MSFIPKPHEIYKHFKGNLYQITAIAEHTETGETLVVYQAMYGDFKTYARPLTMFTSPVDREKYPDAVQEFRFELQGPDAARQKAEMSLSGRTDNGESDTAVSVEKTVRPEASGQQKQEHTDPDGPLRQEKVESAEASGQKTSDCRELSGQGAEEPVRMSEQVCQEHDGSAGLPVQTPAESDDEPEELNIDPLVLEFLDADTYEQRLNILSGLHHRITDDMINTMAIACDVEVVDGDIEERYESLKACLVTMERYECNRLR